MPHGLRTDKEEQLSQINSANGSSDQQIDVNTIKLSEQSVIAASLKSQQHMDQLALDAVANTQVPTMEGIPSLQQQIKTGKNSRPEAASLQVTGIAASVLLRCYLCVRMGKEVGYKSERAILMHLRRKHNERIVQLSTCRLCCIAFTKQTDLDNHLNSSHEFCLYCRNHFQVRIYS